MSEEVVYTRWYKANKLRNKYMDLVKEITSRNPSLDYEDYNRLRDSILEIMRKDVEDYIENAVYDHHTQNIYVNIGDPVISTKFKRKLREELHAFYTSANEYASSHPDESPINVINVIGLQTAIMFSNLGPSLSTYHNNPVLEKCFHHFVKDDEWKDYEKMKDLIKECEKNTEEGDFYYFDKLLYDIHPRNMDIDTHPIFLVSIVFPTLKELVNDMLNNVFLCALTYDISPIDGIYVLPTSALWHDILHFFGYEHCYKYPLIVNEMKEFLKFIDKNEEDKSKRYAMYFLVFCFLHEGQPCKLFGKNGGDSLDTSFFKNVTSEFIYQHLTRYIDSLKSLINIGKSIPQDYREIDMKKNYKDGWTSKPHILNEEKIREYLQRVADIYVEKYSEFRHSKINFLFRHVSKSKTKKTKKVSRKRKVSKKTSKRKVSKEEKKDNKKKKNKRKKSLQKKR